MQDSGRAVLSEEWQIIPEHATIPEAAEVRHDLGTADLPVARLPGAQEEGESLSQMGRRSQSREEQRIDQEVASVEQELQQAKQELEDLLGMEVDLGERTRARASKAACSAARRPANRAVNSRPSAASLSRPARRPSASSR